MGEGGCVVDAACTVTVSPTDGDDTELLQEALLSDDVTSGSTICFCPGEYEVTKELSVKPVPNLTIQGLGAFKEDTVLDFAGQTEGDDGFTATSNGITITNFYVKNTPGNGIVVDGAEDVLLSHLLVTWDAGSVTTNGAYAVYPTHTKRVTVEHCEVVGASDAGIYVGQSEDAVVRYNEVHGNVAGIEVENTTGAEIYENRAYNNAGGLFVPLLQHLERKESRLTRIYNNEVFDNNTRNFGDTNAVISALPSGTGLFVIASDDLQVDGNVFRNNESTAILVIGQDTMDMATGTNNPDPENDRYPERLYVFDNVFEGNGTKPKSVLALPDIAPLEDFVWDGVVNADQAGGAQLCFGDTPPSFRSLNGFTNLTQPENHETDVTPYKCVLDKLPPLRSE